jgi:hypothetical protein
MNRQILSDHRQMAWLGLALRSGLRATSPSFSRIEPRTFLSPPRSPLFVPSTALPCPAPCPGLSHHPSARSARTHLTPHLTTGRVRSHTSLSVHPADLQPPPSPLLSFLPCFANGFLPPLLPEQGAKERVALGPDSDSRWLRSAAKRWEGKRLLVRWLCESEAPLLSPQTEIKRLAFLPREELRCLCLRCLLSDGISSSSAQAQALQRQRAPTALLLLESLKVKIPLREDTHPLLLREERLRPCLSRFLKSAEDLRKSKRL